MKYLFASVTIFVGLSVTGCLDVNTATPKVPQSEATSEEQSQINEVLTSISDLTAKFGERLEFKRIPVIVTTEDWKARKRMGYCRSGRAPYIAINRAMIHHSKGQSVLFNILLHEIGHCYFRREHDCARISKDANYIGIRSGTGNRGITNLMDELTVSIMCSGEGERGESQPFELKEYYVGELLGKVRATQLSDLQKFVDIEYVPHAKPGNTRSLLFR